MRAGPRILAFLGATIRVSPALALRLSAARNHNLTKMAATFEVTASLASANGNVRSITGRRRCISMARFMASKSTLRRCSRAPHQDIPQPRQGVTPTERKR